MPIMSRDIKRDEPPYDMNGSGTPVAGIEAVTTPILTKA
jgi:hypothetical protein